MLHKRGCDCCDRWEDEIGSLKAQLAECRAGIVVPPASQQSATP